MPTDDSRTYEAFLFKVPLPSDASVERGGRQRWLASFRVPPSVISLLAIILHR
jgi:hypothetical protein